MAASMTTPVVFAFGFLLLLHFVNGATQFRPLPPNT